LQATGIKAKELTGKVSKGGRKRVIEWRAPRRVIVATDSASRGMNLDVDLVVNYDLPTSLSQYVHRAGRTGRGFGTGTVISMRKQGEAWAKFEKELGRAGRVRARKVEDADLDRGALRVLKDIMAREEEGDLGYEEDHGNTENSDSSSLPSSDEEEEEEEEEVEVEEEEVEAVKG
jgi:superfamily II DNA/RNA helicase